MEETDHQELHRELESQGDEMEVRRDELKSDTDSARQDFKSKVSDQRVPGLQDDQEDVLEGRKAVEQAEGEEGEGEDSENGADSGGGSAGAGYREDEE